MVIDMLMFACKTRSTILSSLIDAGFPVAAPSHRADPADYVAGKSAVTAVFTCKSVVKSAAT